MLNTTSPPIVSRPLLAVWMYLRGLKPKDASEVLQVGAEQVRRYCLPFGDPLRVVPPAAVMERIVAWTRQEVRPEHFYPKPDGTEHAIPESWIEAAVSGRADAPSTGEAGQR